MNKITNTNQTEPDEHIITSLEAHWYKSRHEWNEDEPLNTEQTLLTHEHPVHNSQWQWEYWCSCGEEFNDWDEAHNHLQDMNTPNSKTE